MEILLWLLPSVVVSCAAMAWVSWLGRERPERERSAAEQERFANAIMRPVPEERRRPRQRERSTGVAQRRGTQGPGAQRQDTQRRGTQPGESQPRDHTRRSA